MKNLFNQQWSLLVSMLALVFVVSCGSDPEPIIPAAGFEYSVQELEVTFTNKSVDAEEFAWDFGDGNTSTEISPVHTYADYGDYDVKLSVTSSDGSTNDFTETITLIDACEIWDGSESDNLIVGGGFEFCDDKYWSTIKSGEPENVKFEYGFEDYNPTDGTDGALYIHPDNDATSDGESTFIYQKVTATDGEYNLSALVKLKGENKDTPTSGMTDYWFEFYVGKTEPVDGTDYKDGKMSGWIYGAWTGWAFVIPNTDGPLVHSYMANNGASAEGNFNLDAGDYYVGIKVGKGGSGTFGDGIAIDKFALKRIGVRNACFDWDGTQTDNLIKGGQMEECDDKYWNILDANHEDSPVEWGYTAYAPSTGANGALYFSTPAASDKASGVGTAGTIYQYIGEFKDGDVLKLAADVKHGGVDGGLHQYWWEMYVWQAEPVEGEEYQPRDGVYGQTDGTDNKVPPIASYTHAGWGPRSDIGVGVAPVATDGKIQYGYNPYDQCDANGEFTLKKDGYYFFVFKFGTWEGSFGEGISIDNLSVTKQN